MHEFARYRAFENYERNLLRRQLQVRSLSFGPRLMRAGVALTIVW